MNKTLLLLLSTYTVYAQGNVPPPPADMHPCGAKCIKDVIAVAEDPNDVIKCPRSGQQKECLCKSLNFWNGIRDCSQQACGTGVYQQVAKWRDLVLCASPDTLRPSGVISAPSTGVTSAPGDYYAYMAGGKVITVSL